MGSSGLRERDGIEAEDVLLRQLTSAAQILEKHQPSRIVTLGRKLLTESAVRCHHEEVDDRGNQEA